MVGCALLLQVAVQQRIFDGDEQRRSDYDANATRILVWCDGGCDGGVGRFPADGGDFDLVSLRSQRRRMSESFYLVSESRVRSSDVSDTLQVSIKLEMILT